MTRVIRLIVLSAMLLGVAGCSSETPASSETGAKQPDAVETSTGAAANAADKVDQGTKAAGDATAKGLNAAGEATGNAIQTAGEATGKALRTAGEATGEALKKAGQATQEAVAGDKQKGEHKENQ